jgi:hypothetical protein
MALTRRRGNAMGYHAFAKEPEKAKALNSLTFWRLKNAITVRCLS